MNEEAQLRLLRAILGSKVATHMDHANTDLDRVMDQLAEGDFVGFAAEEGPTQLL